MEPIALSEASTRIAGILFIALVTVETGGLYRHTIGTQWLGTASTTPPLAALTNELPEPVVILNGNRVARMEASMSVKRLRAGRRVGRGCRAGS